MILRRFISSIFMFIVIVSVIVYEAVRSSCNIFFHCKLRQSFRQCTALIRIFDWSSSSFRLVSPKTNSVLLFALSVIVVIIIKCCHFIAFSITITRKFRERKEYEKLLGLWLLLFQPIHSLFIHSFMNIPWLQSCKFLLIALS